MWLLILWIVLSIIGCLLVALVLGRTCPRAARRTQAASQQTDFTVLGTIATPVVIGVLLYFGWALAFWRQKPGDETDAAPLHGNTEGPGDLDRRHRRDRAQPSRSTARSS